MAPEGRNDGAVGGNRETLNETVGLLRRYVVQETFGPLRHLGKRLGFAAAGALVGGIGVVLLLLAVLRVLQTETGDFFAGNMSFGPYLATAAVACGMLGLIGMRALKGRDRS